MKIGTQFMLALSLSFLALCLVGCPVNVDQTHVTFLQPTPESSPTARPTLAVELSPAASLGGKIAEIAEIMDIQPSPTPKPTLPADAPPEPSPTPLPTPTPEILRIVGGIPVSTPGEWPWHARLAIIINNAEYLCGGSLIDPNWILTAAHCMFDQAGTAASAKDVTVILGDYRQSRIDTSEQTFAVARIIVHPDYDGGRSYNNDIALLKLETVVQLKEQIRPIPLLESPLHDHLAEPGLITATITGWGRTQEGGPLSDVLRQAQVPLVSNGICHQFLAITDNMLCAGFAEGGVDTCQGDSGGPLIVRDSENWRLTGITSWGEGCARPNRYGVYTRISSYVPWITAHIRSTGGFQLVAVHSKKCLDVAGGTETLANNAPIQQWDCFGPNQWNQIWNFVKVGTSYQIIAAHSGKCLEVAGGTEAFTEGAAIQQRNCQGGHQTNQLWNLIEVGEFVQLVAVHSGQCLEVAGGVEALANGIVTQQRTCLGGDQANQLWQRVPVGAFQMIAAHSEKCLEVAGGVEALADRSPIQQWSCLGNEQINQLWHLVPAGVGDFFRIVVAHSGKCLTVSNERDVLTDGAVIQQMNCLAISQRSQLWHLIPIGDSFQVVAAHSGKCLEIAGGAEALADGTAAHQWRCLGDAQASQLWQLRGPGDYIQNNE